MTTTMLMHWLWPAAIGFVVGALAKLIFVGIMRSGFWITAIVGVVGAVGAAFVAERIGWYPQGHLAGYIAAVLGAVALLVLFQLFTTRA